MATARESSGSSSGERSSSGSGESESERRNRNWNEILQELRVTQTGTQILTGFLLTIPFQAGFSELGAVERGIYLVLVGLAALATVLALTPVALHRALFRQRAKPQVIALAHVIMRIALVAIALTLTGTTLLIFDLVLGTLAGLVAGGVTLVLATAAWFLLPVFARGAEA